MHGKVIFGENRSESPIFTSGGLGGPVEAFVKACQEGEARLQAEKNQPTISVPVTASSLALLYERIRNLIDYKADHLLRRNAVQRILARKIETGKSDTVAYDLIQELTWARYLKNDSLPKIELFKVAKIIDKYRLLIADIQTTAKDREFILGLVSVEIERELVSPYQIDAMINLMYQVILPKNVQSFLAICRSLTKLDQENLSYFLFSSPSHHWPSATQISQIRKSIQTELNSAQTDFYFRFVKKYTAPFLVLADLVFTNPETAPQILSHSDSLEQEVRKFWGKRFQAAKQRFNREATRSVIFVFITKMTIALILELPFDFLVTHRVNVLPLSINLVFPPLLMFLVVSTIRLPGEENTRRLVEIAKEIVSSGKIARAEFSLPSKKKPGWKDYFFRGIFGALFTLSFFFVGWLLYRLHFNLVSAAIFFFFLSVILFFGFLIRESAREMSVVKEKEGILTSLLDLISLPFLEMGKWLSGQLGRLNVFTFILDVIIEAPVKGFIQIVEDWISFLKERKEEAITNLPR
jgi:hypothetical protein